MKLKAITFEKAPMIPGLRAGDMITIKCDEPSDAMKGWRAMLRGPALFLVSPPGWAPNDRAGAPGLPCRVHEIARSQCYLHWEGPDNFDEKSIAKYTSEPFGRPAPIDTPEAPSLLAQLPRHQQGDD